MERNKRLKAADKCASRYTNENDARIARTAFMLGCEFEAQGEVVKGVILETEEDHWKPSEEQMKALLNAERFLRAGLQHDSAKTIAELYEQLKQL